MNVPERGFERSLSRFCCKNDQFPSWPQHPARCHKADLAIKRTQHLEARQLWRSFRERNLKINISSGFSSRETQESAHPKKDVTFGIQHSKEMTKEAQSKETQGIVPNTPPI